MATFQLSKVIPKEEIIVRPETHLSMTIGVLFEASCGGIALPD